MADALPKVNSKSFARISLPNSGRLVRPVAIKSTLTSPTTAILGRFFPANFLRVNQFFMRRRRVDFSLRQPRSGAVNLARSFKAGIARATNIRVALATIENDEGRLPRNAFIAF